MNYRSVSLLPFITKTLERVVFNQVSAFLTQNNLLDSNQSGFRSGHSTETALLSIVEALRLARAASKSTSQQILAESICYFWYSQLPDPPVNPIEKGISGTAHLWFDSYRSDRSFNISWRGEVSKSQHLTTGMPQGSVLRPLLFSVYMASLGSVIQKHGFSYHCYAEDTQLYLSFHPDDLTIAARISACLTDISSWMKDHHLQLNLAKTELCVVSANPSFHHNFTFQLGSSTITPSKTARNLGVVIDDQLNFSDITFLKLPGPADLLYIILGRLGPFSLGTCFTTPCSGSCSVQTWLLQCSLIRSSSQFHQTSTINPICCCKINL